MSKHTAVWVKATDRLPGAGKIVRWRFNSVENNAEWVQPLEVVIKFDFFSNMEWLDETPVSTVQEEGAEDAFKLFLKPYGNRPMIDSDWCNDMFESFKAGRMSAAPAVSSTDREGVEKYLRSKLMFFERGNTGDFMCANSIEEIITVFLEWLPAPAPSPSTDEGEPDEWTKKHLAAIKEKILIGLCATHFTDQRHLIRASMEYFLSGGNVNGMFFEAIEKIVAGMKGWMNAPAPPPNQSGEIDAVGFAEWASDKGWQFKRHGNVWQHTFTYEFKTSSELYQIYQLYLKSLNG